MNLIAVGEAKEITSGPIRTIWPNRYFTPNFEVSYFTCIFAIMRWILPGFEVVKTSPKTPSNFPRNGPGIALRGEI